MEIDISIIELPVTVTTGKSSKVKDSYIEYTESFSEKYKNKLPKTLLLELGFLFSLLNGFSKGRIKDINRALCFWCEYSFKKRLASLSEANSQIILEYQMFLKGKYPTQKTWQDKFRDFKRIVKDYLSPNIVWPYNPHTPGEDSTTTAIAPEAFMKLIKCLVKEIDRIRLKKAKYLESMNIGRVLDLECISKFCSGSSCVLTTDKLNEIKDLIANGTNTAENVRYLAEKFKTSKANIYYYIRRIKAGNPPKVIPDFEELTIHNILKTICYYLPNWPVSGSPHDDKNEATWRVYKSPRGVLHGEYQSLLEAQDQAQMCGGFIIESLKRWQLDLMNPAEILLVTLGKASGTEKTRFMKQLQKNVGKTADIIETYFPTNYDWTCVLMYWLCVTGWNIEAVNSVNIKDIGINVDIRKRNVMGLFSDDHSVLEGSVNNNNTHNNRNLIEEYHTSIKGLKRRSQPINDPKVFTHVSDMHDKYSLQNVLLDFYETSLPLRSSLIGDENNCILIGLVPGGKRRSNNNITVFGNCKRSVTDPVIKNKTAIKLFFKKHLIEEKQVNGRSIRLKEITSKIIRTSFESYLSYSGVTLEQRQIIMGHNQIETTVTSYGAEKISKGLRREDLRNDLSCLAEKAFLGQLESYLQEPKKKSKNVIQVFEYRKSQVMWCHDTCKPTWIGHEYYVSDGKVCSHFDECLHCEQCRIGIDTLPYLIRWKREINEWIQSYGLLNVSEKEMLRRQAIEEVLQMCRNRGGEWYRALVDAEITEKNPDFIAPPMTYRYVDLQDKEVANYE